MRPITQSMRRERRKAAETRHIAYLSLSKKDKLALIASRRGQSKREYIRVYKG